MKIAYVKFFQPVDLPLSGGGKVLQNYAMEKTHNVQFDGTLLRLTHVAGNSKTILTSIQNVQFMEVSDDTDSKTEKGSSAASGKTKVKTEPQG